MWEFLVTGQKPVLPMMAGGASRKRKKGGLRYSLGPPFSFVVMKLFFDSGQQTLDGRLGIPKEHHGIVFVEKFILNPGKADIHGAF